MNIMIDKAGEHWTFLRSLLHQFDGSKISSFQQDVSPGMMKDSFTGLV
jgi:hypothetical protein